MVRSLDSQLSTINPQLKLWHVRAEATPIPGEGHDDVKGAFVNFVVPGTQRRDIRRQVREFLARVGFRLVRLHALETVESVFATGNPGDELRSLALAAAKSGELQYGSFYTWTCE